ncbi:MAG: tRNA (adenosine(37)-N6)-dimethylallyltransferase MiaA [Lachnospiraceae bacterium]|nr:tRNA (adenosine(37)-N6)-dimethylallyltransferase MiaA [Lachnospiraceae bacterium]
MQDLIIIAGPTAVGKSALSIELAKKIGGSIISADSMQVYRGMDIGTAKLSREEMQGIPHYLIDVLDPSEDFSIFRFKEMAGAAIEEIASSGRIPIIVGGTGFYIQSVLYDIDFDESEEMNEYRESLQKLIDEKGAAYVHKMLEEADPKAAERIHMNDHKRMIRALEYSAQTGGMISEHNEMSSKRTSPYNFCYFVLVDDRAEIYERINTRVDMMIEAGLEGEVRKLLESGLTPDNISMQGIGYKEMIPYVMGQCSLEDAVYNMKLNTRHFAKRQLTWYRRERDVVPVDVGASDPFGEMMKELKRKGIVND